MLLQWSEFSRGCLLAFYHRWTITVCSLGRLSFINMSSLLDTCRYLQSFCISRRALTFVYPFGATLNVMKPAVAVLSTGSVCFPLNRPILAFYQHEVWLCLWQAMHSPPTPRKNCEHIFGSTYISASILIHLQIPDEPSDSCLLLWKTLPGVRGELIWWSAKIIYLFNWQMDIFSSSLKFEGFFPTVLVII